MLRHLCTNCNIFYVSLQRVIHEAPELVSGRGKRAELDFEYPTLIVGIIKTLN